MLYCGFDRNLGDNTTVICGKNKWSLAYCQANATAPHLCIDCGDPCLNACAENRHLISSFTTDYQNCTYDEGNLKLFYAAMSEDISGGEYVISSFSAMWVVVVTLLSISFWYKKRSKHVEPTMSKSALEKIKGRTLLSKWTLTRFKSFRVYPVLVGDSPQEIQQILMKIVTEKLFAPFDMYSFRWTRAMRSLWTYHRAIRMITNFDKDAWYGLWFTTSMVVYGLLVACFLQYQYPYDDGSCAAENTFESCLALTAEFVEEHHLCRWGDLHLLEQYPGSPLDYQTFCIYKYQEVEPSDLFRIAFIVYTARILIFEPCLKRYLLPATRSKKLSPEMPIRIIDEDKMQDSANQEQKLTAKQEIMEYNRRRRAELDKEKSSATSNIGEALVLPSARKMKDFFVEINPLAINKQVEHKSNSGNLAIIPSSPSVTKSKTIKKTLK